MNLTIRPWGQWTLRSRLVLVIVVLATVALAAANAVGLLLLRSSLIQRVDDQLIGQSRPYHSGVRPEFASTLQVPSRPRLARFGPDQLLVVFGADGVLEAERSWTPASGAPELTFGSLPIAEPYTVVSPEGVPWRLFAVKAGTSGGVVVLGASLADVEHTGDLLLVIDFSVLVLVLVLLGFGAAAVVRLGLRPLTRMEETAAAITAGNLSRRVGDTDPHTESGRLGAALNLMLGRVQSEVSARDASERRLRQFVADASHELRTPLTSIRGFAELYRCGGTPAGPQLDEAMSRIESEASRMGVLVEDLILLARLDMQRPPHRSRVDLLEIAADTISDAHARMPDRPVFLAGFEGADVEPPTVLGDEHRLRQVATNLVNNALLHTPAGTRVTVRVSRAAAAPPAAGTICSGAPPAPTPAALAMLEVSDDGPGVPPDHAGRIFERLYRADPSRTRGRGGGSGLGLSIVASIVHAHGGWVELDTGPGAGTTFRVFLPAVPAAS